MSGLPVLRVRHGARRPPAELEVPKPEIAIFPPRLQLRGDDAALREEEIGDLRRHARG